MKALLAALSLASIAFSWYWLTATSNFYVAGVVHWSPHSSLLFWCFSHCCLILFQTCLICFYFSLKVHCCRQLHCSLLLFDCYIRFSKRNCCLRSPLTAPLPMLLVTDVHASVTIVLWFLCSISPLNTLCCYECCCQLHCQFGDALDCYVWFFKLLLLSLLLTLFTRCMLLLLVLFLLFDCWF